MAKIGVGGTKFRKGGMVGGVIDAPSHVLAQMSRDVPAVLQAPLPKYPPGDPRNAAPEQPVAKKSRKRKAA